MAVLVVSTDTGDFAIQEHEVSTITAAELCQLRMSRVDLGRLFAEAAKLLLGRVPINAPHPCRLLVAWPCENESKNRHRPHTSACR